MLIPPVAASSSSASATSSAALLQAMNEVRRTHGLTPLRVDARLTRAARAHSSDMIRRQYFAHGALAPRLKRFKVRGPLVGENLAWGVGALAHARAVVAQWMASPPHRANLLRPGFRRVGVGSAFGRFAGHSRARVVTADFAG